MPVGELGDVSGYHFDGAGKYFRPMIVLLTAKACNLHQDFSCRRQLCILLHIDNFIEIHNVIVKSLWASSVTWAMT